jgi:endonuclease/exonuclease/phosphatase (EEP) superfamily protein YafD
LGAPELRFLVDDEVPSVRTAIRLRSGVWIDFYGVHPNPPRPGDDTGERDAELLLVGKEVKAKARPAIVAGDLNDVAWSHSTRLFQRISGMLDPRIGRGMYSTFHARYPGLRWALDHVFHTEEFALVALRRLPYFGSDHFPMLIELCHHPAAAAKQEPPEADGADRKEAAAKIAEGREDARS